MIDIHCHILPGIDDGSKSIHMSLEMAVQYQKSGFSHVVATPHFMYGTSWAPRPEVIKDRVNKLQKAIQKAGISLNVFSGMEIALDPEIPGLIRKKHVIPLAGSSYFLIEPPFHWLPPGWEDIPLSVLENGYHVILAHPERCSGFLENPELLEKLVSAGIYTQVNRSSFQGFHGKHSQNLALKLAEKRLIHFMATDSHDPQKRSCVCGNKCFENLKKLMGEKNLKILTWDNPVRLLMDKPPERMVAFAGEAARCRSKLGWIWGRK